MKPLLPFAVVITPTNNMGEYTAARFTRWDDACAYCRDNVSYTGDKVRRVEIVELGTGRRAMWDISWDVLSKLHGLWERTTP